MCYYCPARAGQHEARESQLEQRAEVAELADALGSGSSEGNLLGVQIPPSAPCNSHRIDPLAEQALLNPLDTFHVTLPTSLCHVPAYSEV